MGAYYVLGTMLNTSHTYLILKQPYEVGFVIIPTLQREEQNQVCLMPEPAHLTFHIFAPFLE